MWPSKLLRNKKRLRIIEHAIGRAGNCVLIVQATGELRPCKIKLDDILDDPRLLSLFTPDDCELIESLTKAYTIEEELESL